MSNQLCNLFDGCLPVEENQSAESDFLQLPTCKGLILFADAADNPIQLLTAANIRRTARARLPAKPAATATNITDICRKIYYRCCFCDFNNNLTYLEIAKKLFAKDYKELINFGKAWYLKIDLSHKFPFFTITSSAEADGNVKLFGPFLSQKNARAMLHMLQDVFLLCRRSDLIANSQKSRTCPYLQMQNCSSVCAGKISRPQYLQQVNAAIATATGNIDSQTQSLTEQMRSLAGKLQFEQAQAIQKRLELLKLRTAGGYRWISEISRLSILHIDRSKKIKVPSQRAMVQSYSAFLISAGRIRQLPDFTIEKIEKFCRSLPAEIFQPLPPHTELLNLVSYFLYRSKPAGLWLDWQKLLSAETLEEKMRLTFQPKTTRQ